jgi:NAD(P)H-hydrate repair Nnr-like enzyme with NAD(P)H-hydrate epimerase domain
MSEQKEQTTIPEDKQEAILTENFFTLQGYQVPGVSAALFEELLRELKETFLVSETQIAESAAYSTSMVIRHALGLSAEGGIVSIIADDSLQGRIALNAGRYLRHAGAACHALVYGTSLSEDFERAARALEVLEVPIHKAKSSERIATWLETSVQRSQHMLIGLHYAKATNALSDLQLINEAICPAHAISAPPGIDPDTGKAAPGAIFASSTLSLGVPLNGLYQARQYVGRHYVCDISLSARVLDQEGSSHPLFADQPVQVLLPELPPKSH